MNLFFNINTCTLPNNCKRVINHKNDVEGALHFDSRQIVSNTPSVFVAIKSKLRDGHQFIADAYKKGCRNFIVSNTHLLPKDVNYILCPDTLLLLQAFAKEKRQNFDFPLLAISGSNGKTVVKEWLLELINPSKKLVYSQKSYNSQLGVALSILSSNNSADLGIFEAGISEKGEMRHLAAMLQANFGILTNIGNSHLQNFRNKKDLLTEKLQLFKNCQWLLCRHQDFIEFNNEFKNTLSHCKIYTWGNSNKADIKIDFESGTAKFGKIKVDFNTPNLSALWLENVGTCIAFALVNNCCDAHFLRQIGQLTNIENRLALSNTIGHNFILNDSYSLDLESLQGAINYFNNQVRKEQKLLVLSAFDNENKDLHQKCITFLVEHKDCKFFLLGDYWHNFLEELRPLNHRIFNDKNSLLEACKNEYASHSMLFKGARKWQIESVVDALLKFGNRSYLEINLAAIRRNVAKLKQDLPLNCKFLAMLKADAYGGGLQRIAKSLQNAGVDYFGVAFTQEAIALREAGVRLPILVIHPFAEDIDLALMYNLELTAYSPYLLKQWQVALKDKAKKLAIHLEIETGMHRQGFTINQLQDLDESALKAFDVKGSLSHLAESGVKNGERSKKQISEFEKALKLLRQKNIDTGIVHLLNSEGIVMQKNKAYNMVRSGIALFGAFNGVEFALKLASKISKIQRVEKGEYIGYGDKNKLSESANIAIVPLGYADALPYNIKPKLFKAKINGKYYPLAAAVCMDMLMLNLGNDKASEGDTVEVIYDYKSLQAIANASDSISYEILSRFSQRIKRIFIDE